jgi:hypothetical protein
VGGARLEREVSSERPRETHAGSKHGSGSSFLGRGGDGLDPG